ncbi:MAG TPA: DUF3293 domain-containing protein [Verrucomicrobiae bacterium]|nr:DUF3293 domain-containing protein [Verrucomicrobiae bacterium]
MPPVPDELVKAYRNANYRVHAQPPFELRVDNFSIDLDRVLESTRSASAALLTAYNPQSHKRPAPENAAAQAELKGAVAAHVCLEAEGRGEGWPPEPSLLVLGLTRSEAATLARRFGQHAYLYCEPKRPVELVLVEKIA